MRRAAALLAAAALVALVALGALAVATAPASWWPAASAAPRPDDDGSPQGGPGQPGQPGQPAQPGELGEDFVAAQVLALRDVDVPAELAGRVVRRPETEHPAVRAGDVVVEIDSVLARAAARAARAAATRAGAHRDWTKLELARVEKLFGSSAVGQADLDQARVAAEEAEASLASAEATAEEAEARLDKVYVRAPFDGKIVRVFPELGEYLRPGDTAFRVIDDSRLRLVAYVPAAWLARLEVGTPVEFASDVAALELPVLRAKVVAVAPAAEGAARTFRVEARADDPSHRWRPGMTAQLRRVGSP